MMIEIGEAVRRDREIAQHEIGRAILAANQYLFGGGGVGIPFDLDAIPAPVYPFALPFMYDTHSVYSSHQSSYDYLLPLYNIPAIRWSEQTLIGRKCEMNVHLLKKVYNVGNLDY
jgi:hypothetical protein